jgi:glycosyltransferase involved in cell wall biosynthesis
MTDATMSEPRERELQFGIDRLVTNGKRIFGWGWVAHPTCAIETVTLRLEGDGWAQRLPVHSGLERADVERAFPGLCNGRASGFVMTGFPTRHPADRTILEVRFEDGATGELDITGVAETRKVGQRRFRELLWLVRAAARRLKRGDIAGIVRRARAQNYTAPSLDDDHAARNLLPGLRGGPPACIVFDHNMGGGANQYRRQWIGERVAGGAVVLLCTYNLPSLDYRLEVLRQSGGEEIYRISSFAGLEPILAQTTVGEIFVNSAVSFDEPLLFADWIAAVRAAHPAARLTIAVHDYFAVCPSFVLLNADGRYCGIPDVAECAKCLPRHQARYVALSPPTEIGPWRSLWGRCLAAADEVRCFSDSTRRLLRRAYPDLDAARISVVPHRVDYAPPRLPAIDHSAPLVIGIVGQISEQKGALVVREMLARIDRDHPEVRVVVIGALDLPVKSERLRVTGTYRHEDLVDLIEANAINLFFFPSICPETFSYVTEEMIRLALPIVAFDLGAPGDRLRSYPNARLADDVSARSALETLLDFHAALAAREVSVA